MIKSNQKKRKKIFQFTLYGILYSLLFAIIVGVTTYYLALAFVIPIGRVTDTSELIMFGDLNSDRKWDEKDESVLQQFLDQPWMVPTHLSFSIDINRNHKIDREDIEILNTLYRESDPYKAYEVLEQSGKMSPKPREMFAYVANDEYMQRPVYVLDHSAFENGILSFLEPIRHLGGDSDYQKQLVEEIYSEALRFSLIYQRRVESLVDIEKDELAQAIASFKRLYDEGEFYDLLVNLILWSEVGETLTVSSQTPMLLNIRLLAYDFRNYLISADFQHYENGDREWEDVFEDMEGMILNRLGKAINLQSLESPRDLTELRNYSERAIWQFYKSKNKDTEFHELLNYAQHDRRYLRAVSRTTRRHQDRKLLNHNVPMMLLFREALRISKGDKKAAVGLLDEAIRIPFAWVKSIPKKNLPSSIALENFLLPGNMEDGSDKSRHWNVFGGLGLYRSPEESFEIALRREIMDVRSGEYSVEIVTEFIRDMIANCFGIYHIVSFDESMDKKD